MEGGRTNTLSTKGNMTALKGGAVQGEDDLYWWDSPRRGGLMASFPVLL